MKLMRNIEAYGRDVALVTATAPGTDVLPWDVDQETGELLRQVVPWVAEEWNRAAPANWRRIHRAASQRAARRARALGGEWRIVAREWEFQRRGVLHVHVVVPMGSSLERICSQVYVAALDELAARNDFGFIDRGRAARDSSGVWKRTLPVVPQERAARYLAKYVAGVKADGRLALSETVSRPDVPAQVVYVGRHLTSATGCTMQTLRRRRYAYSLYNRAVDVGVPTDVLVDMADAGDEHLIAVLAPIVGRAP